MESDLGIVIPSQYSRQRFHFREYGRYNTGNIGQEWVK